MKSIHIQCALLLAVCPLAVSQASDVAVCTDNGRFTIELFDEQAPMHVESFLAYVDSGFYANTVFHRVINGFVMQGGGYDRGLQSRTPNPPVQNESRNGLRNSRGTVAAARTSNPHSANSQFYVNLRDNPTLDADGDEFGYTVFGRVTEGMDIVDSIAQLPTRAAGPFNQDVPDPLVGIVSVARLDHETLGSLPEDGREEAIRQRITAATDDEEKLEWLDHYRAVCAPMDAELLLTEAHAAHALEREDRARTALEGYFQVAGSVHPQYQEALALYEEVAGEDAAAQTAGARELASRCSSPALPTIPDGDTATFDQMLRGQEQVRGFVTQSEAYLECLAEMIDDASLDLSPQERELLVAEHNATVGVMEGLAAQFNQELRVFRAREQQQ